MNKTELLKKKGVVIVYTGKKVTRGVETDMPAVRCGVTKKLPPEKLAREDAIPALFEGLPTDVFETEPIKALRSEKHRPAPGGVCISHPKVTGGTLGMVVKKQGVIHILSNNHVMANCNDAKLYDEIWQPGHYAGGSSCDTIAHLSNFVPLHFEGTTIACPVARFLVRLFMKMAGPRLLSTATNTVDAAIARPVLDIDVSAEILEIGKPAGFARAAINDKIRKSGWTSGLTRGFVLGIDGAARVNYGNRYATLEDQVVATPMASPGDSGSVGVDENDNVVGLLFAGSDQLTLFNKIDNVIEALGLERAL